MQLSELFLDRHLYRDNNQDSSTKDSVFEAADSSGEAPYSIPAGGAAQDINTGNTYINGGLLEPGTIPQTVLDVSNWGWTQDSAFTSTDADTVSWGAGTFTSAGGDTYSISAGNTGNMAAKTYIYLDLNVSETAYQTTTTSANSVGIGKVIIGVAENGASSATYDLTEANQIVGDNILANTIDASKIVAGSITTDRLEATAIDGMTITGALVRTSSSGERVEMSSDELRSYDSSNNQRMQLSGKSLFFFDDSEVTMGSIYGASNSIGLFAGTNKNAVLMGDGSGTATLGIDGSSYFYASGGLTYNVTTKHIIPSASGKDLGSIGSFFNDLYINDIFCADDVDVGDNLTVADNITAADGVIKVTAGFIRLAQMSGSEADARSDDLVDGNMYYRTDDDVIRVRLNGTWRTITTS